MTIGIDISQIVYEGTGVATYTENLVRNLLTTDGKNQYVLFGASLRRINKIQEFFHEFKENPKVCPHIVKLPPLFLEILWNYLHVCQIEKFTGKIDLFHSSDWTEAPSSCPKVTTIHDLAVYKFPEQFPGRIKQNHYRKLSWVRKESEMIIADSKATKQDIIDILKIPEEKIKVVHLAPRNEFKRENLILKGEVVKEKFGLTKSYFLSVGTREPRKNLKRTIAAYKNFKSKDEVDLVIVGNFGWGEDIAPISEVRILGFIANDELAALYQEALAFVFPSLYEGFGLPVLEAQSMGCPIISSSRGSLKEVLSKKSIAVNPEREDEITNAMEMIYSLYESDKYFEMVKEGIEFSKKFSWEKTAKETLKVYEEVAKG